MKTFDYHTYTKINNKISVTMIVSDWLIIFAVAYLSEIIDVFMIKFLSIFLIAGRMMALSEVIGHDAVHYNLFSIKSLNKKLDFLYFIPCFETFENYRREHLLHHKYLLANLDPSVSYYQSLKLYKMNSSNIYFYWFVRPFLLTDSLHIVCNILKKIATDKQFRIKILSFWIPILLLFAYMDSLYLLLLYWIIPFLWIKPAFEFWSEVSDHYQAGEFKTRTCIGLIHTLFINPHNDGYHYIHHKFPKIPCYNLKTAHNEYKQVFGTKEYNFLEVFFEIRNNLKESRL